MSTTINTCSPLFLFTTFNRCVCRLCALSFAKALLAFIKLSIACWRFICNLLVAAAPRPLIAPLPLPLSLGVLVPLPLPLPLGFGDSVSCWKRVNKKWTFYNAFGNLILHLNLSLNVRRLVRKGTLAFCGLCPFKGSCTAILRGFHQFSILCVRTAKALARLHKLTWAFAVCIYVTSTLFSWPGSNVRRKAEVESWPVFINASYW